MTGPLIAAEAIHVQVLFGEDKKGEERAKVQGRTL
jgi:hypothetical protein